MPKLRSIQHLAVININDNWETPLELLFEAIIDFDIHPTLDVCATPKTTKCINHFSKNEDGLIQEWDQDFFMNPPYSEIEKWIKKAYEESKKYNVTGIALTYSKTDTKWWHKYVKEKAEVHPIEGRIKFLVNGVVSDNSSPYPSCFIIWRKNES